MTPERYQRLLHEFGLDRPLPVQYLDYVWRALRGDLGVSTITHEPVFREFIARFPATIELSVCAMLLALLIGLPAGMLAAVKRNTVWDYSVMGASLTGYSMPIFWWGLLLILMFSVGLGWTPVSGRIAIQYDIPPVTGFMLIDSLLSSARRARSAARSRTCPAVDRARHDPARGDRAHDALEPCSRCCARTTSAPRARRARRRSRVIGDPRAAQRADPGRHDDRPAGRHAAWPARS